MKVGGKGTTTFGKNVRCAQNVQFPIHQVHQFSPSTCNVISLIKSMQFLTPL